MFLNNDFWDKLLVRQDKNALGMPALLFTLTCP